MISCYLSSGLATVKWSIITNFVVVSSVGIKRFVCNVLTLNVSTPYLLTIIVLKFEKIPFAYVLMCLKIAG